MDIDIITQYILAIVPAFTAIVGMVVSLGVGIGTIKKANTTTIEKVEKTTRSQKKVDDDLRAALLESHKENVELKKELEKITAKMEHMYFVEKDVKKKEE